ncbi:PspC domain-containing protein [Geodermatophilus sabuli]|uniref:PspC domain-containing protein n=1 Tax=Geodermatophilus sabuli TaxID=1564158 RepID=A0A7K3W0N4_9ACTN|nr:PspC domain-containing protein [Geodermatophilus sabuli]NEK57913.1 PspC domain-containing protein [Geodermatophilus sabuli]
MTTSVPPTPPSFEKPVAPQPGGRPQLRRSGTDRLAGGVCGGLAEYSGIDSLLWRVGFVGLTLAGGAGVLVYLLLWVLMPPAPVAADAGRSPLDQLAGRLHDAITRLTSPRT